MRHMWFLLSMLVALIVLASTSNADDGVVIRLPARVTFAPMQNLSMKHQNTAAFGHSAEVAHAGLDITVDIGTPAKPFHLYAMMGLGDSWLVGNPDIADVDQLYNASESSTATNLGRGFNIDRVVNGSLFADILKIDQSGGGSLAVNHSFGVAERMADVVANMLSMLRVDGFLGLAPEVRTHNDVPSLLQSLASSHNITTTTVWIESWSNKSVNPADPRSTLNASITFGGLDPEHCNSGGWTSAQWGIPQQWTLKLENMTISTGEQQAINAPVYFGAGLCCSMFPKRHTDFIAKAVNGTPYQEMMYRVPCSQLTCGPTVELSFNTHPGGSPAKLQFAPKDYIIRVQSDFCLLAFFHYPEGYPEGLPLMLGGPVFNRYCVAIDTHEGVVKITDSLK